MKIYQFITYHLNGDRITSFCSRVYETYESAVKALESDTQAQLFLEKGISRLIGSKCGDSYGETITGLGAIMTSSPILYGRFIFGGKDLFMDGSKYTTVRAIIEEDLVK